MEKFSASTTSKLINLPPADIWIMSLRAYAHTGIREAAQIVGAKPEPWIYCPDWAVAAMKDGKVVYQFHLEWPKAPPSRKTDGADMALQNPIGWWHRALRWARQWRPASSPPPA